MADKEKKVALAESKNKPEKPAKEKKEKKKGKIKEAWRGFKSETKKIVWPTWKQVFKNTLVVLIIIAVFVVIISLLDYAFSGGIRALVDFVPKGN